MLYDNVPAYRSTLITDFFTKNGILAINYSPYRPDLAMKGKRYAELEDIQRSMTAILNIISTDEIKVFFNSLIDCANLTNFII